jgi:hypothetical protein
MEYITLLEEISEVKLRISLGFLETVFPKSPSAYGVTEVFNFWCFLS